MGIYYLICTLFWFHGGIYCRSFCGNRRQPIVNICTDHKVGPSNYILIDTARVPDFQQTSCECDISTGRHDPFKLLLYLVNYTQRFSMKFELNEIVIDKKTIATLPTTLTRNNKKLSFSTRANHQRDGACLCVYSTNNSIKFNIACKRSTIHPPNPDISIPALLATLAFVCCSAFAVISVVCYKRRKSAMVTKDKTRHYVNTETEGDNYMTENPTYNNGQSSIAGSVIHSDAGIISGQYESIGSIQEIADGKHCSEHLPNHPVSYDYVELSLTGVNTSAANNKAIHGTIDSERNFSNLKEEDKTVYDCTNATPPQQAIGQNDYNHLSTISPTEQCVFGLYDKVEQVALTNNEKY
ncbi:uncharacterized protein LOC132743634 isoform X2 [Ruditapes philippinarum]|uniref:uncharacterized protein LOC132743634 isoform X2 n=1 Tax=Ruditapes philippinarum TaxID=129788 RepID=UPI00295BAA35|nr:uncharacterized protein LOC132743634 isoform X2 [Ruditapes philippinarum]